jgi:hypothetical protein
MQQGRSIRLMALASLQLAWLGGCGGGGNPGSEPPTPPPPPPQPAVTTATGTASNGAAYRIRVLAMGANQLAWDAGRHVLYGTVTATSPFDPTTLAVLDPASATVTGSAQLSSAATTLRTTDDAQYLYVGLDSEGKIERLTLPSLQLDQTIALGPTTFLNRLKSAGDIEPQPGNAHTIAVIPADSTVEPESQAVEIYDDTVLRPKIVTFPFISAIAWSPDASTIYGFTTGESSPKFAVYSVAADGASLSNEIQYGLFGLANSLTVVDGLIQANDGEVLDAATLNRVGYYAGPNSNCFYADRPSGAATIVTVCASLDGSDSMVVETFDPKNFSLIASATVPNLTLGANGYPSSVVHWGANGIAFTTHGDQIVLLDGDFLTSTVATLVAAPTASTLVAAGTSTAGVNFSVRELDIGAYDVASDSTRNVLYLSIPGESDYAPNTVATLDPVTASFTRLVPAGSEPDTLALSSDAQYLYVGVDGASSIQRFELDGFMSDFSMSLGRAAGPLFARWIFGAPATPHTIAVALSVPLDVDTTPGAGLAVFDDAIMRPQIGGIPDALTGGGPTADFMQWGATAATLYGANTQTSAADLSTYAVDAGGLHLESSVSPAIGSKTLVYSGGYLYDGLGHTQDPVTGKLLSTVDFFQSNFNDSPVIVDEALNTVYYCVETFGSPTTVLQLVIVPRGATTPRDVIKFTVSTPTDIPMPIACKRYGNDGLAVLLSTGQLFLVESPAIAGP